MNIPFRKIFLSLVMVSLYAALYLAAYSQQSRPDAPPRPEITRRIRDLKRMAGDSTSEKSIEVDRNIKISLCVTQGNLKINGWNRGEVRVFVKEGAKFAFRTLQKSIHSDSPGWIRIVGMDTAKGKFVTPGECVWGDDIEIDAPVNSTINVNGRETKTTIDGVRKADITINGGNISLRNITGGINARTFEGDVTVEESQGAMMLDTTTGNILVFDAGPSEIGDVFRARTNSGTISLQSLGHRQIDVSSTSGSVFYDGEILSGGTYNLNTLKGSIKMSIPANSSCQVVASYGYGTFVSELPLKIEMENIYEGPAKRQIGLIGKGGAVVKLSSNSGSILIKKRQPPIY